MARPAALLAITLGMVAALSVSLANASQQVGVPAKSPVVEVVDRRAWVVPGAKVQLLGKKKKVQFEGVTNDDGRIEVIGIAPGKYTLHVSALGFDPFVRKHVTIPAPGIFEVQLSCCRTIAIVP